MKTDEIKKYYDKKIIEIKKHNKLYFEKNSPKISDKDFDKIKISFQILRICSFEKLY